MKYLQNQRQPTHPSKTKPTTGQTNKTVSKILEFNHASSRQT